MAAFKLTLHSCIAIHTTGRGSLLLFWNMPVILRLSIA